MKIYLFFLVFMSSIMMMAQDVIVLKTGDLIKSQIIEIGEDNVKYKKWENIDGPTYTLSIMKILSINYQNGTKDDFSGYEKQKTDVAQSIDESSKNISQSIYMSGNNISRGIDNSVFLSQQRMISRGRALRTVGWIACIGCAASGIAVGGFTDVGIWVGGVGVGVGMLVGFPLIYAGNRKISTAKEIVTTANLYQFQINKNVAVSACTMAYEPNNQRTLGAGVSVRF